MQPHGWCFSTCHTLSAMNDVIKANLDEISFARITSCFPERQYRRGKRETSRIYNTGIGASEYGLEFTDKYMPRSVDELELCSVADNPMYPAFEEATSRLQTFKDFSWPRVLIQYVTAFSAFGFFYMGKATSVMCYHCGIAIGDWKGGLVNNESITLECRIQHAVLNPHCALIQPLYRDTVFHQEFMGWDILNSNYHLKTFLGQIGRDTSKYDENRAAATPPTQPDVEARDNNSLVLELSLLRNELLDHKLRLEEPRSNACGICLVNVKNVASLPCGHVYNCFKCHAKIKKNNGRNTLKCALCFAEVLAIKLVYIN